MHRAVDDTADWDLHAELSAMTVDMLALLAWLQSSDAQKNRNRPKPLARPGDQKKTNGPWAAKAAGVVDVTGEDQPESDGRKFGTTRMSIDDATNWLGW